MVQQIVWINKSPWRKPGPIVPMGVRNAAACAETGIPTTLFLSSDETLNPEQIGADLCDFYGFSEAIDNLTIQLCPANKSLHPLRPVYRQALTELRHQLARGKTVMALTREEGLLPALLRLRNRSQGRLQVVHETHDYFAELKRFTKPSWDDRRRQQVARRYFPRLDGLLCLTDDQVRLYRTNLPNCPPLIALPLGTEDRGQTDSEDLRQRRTLSYVGHLHESKGRGTILEASKQLSRAGIHLHLFGGSPEQAGKLQARLDKRMKGEGKALVRPFLPPREMHQLLSREASVGLILLEHNYYNRHLTCPVKALDCLSHGLPALASDLPSTRQVLGEAASYLPPGQPDKLVTAAIALLDSSHQFTTLAQASLARRQQLLWSERARQLLAWQGHKLS